MVTCHGCHVIVLPELARSVWGSDAHITWPGGFPLQRKVAALKFFFSERYMTTYIALRELFTSNKTALQGVASSSDTSDPHNGDGECHPPTTSASYGVLPAMPGAAKRAYAILP